MKTKLCLKIIFFFYAFLLMPTTIYSQETDPNQISSNNIKGMKTTSERVSNDVVLKKEYSIFDDTMADMTWQEIGKAAEQNAVVLLPLGVIEEHGPHIACGSDIYQSYLYCKLIKQELHKSGVPAIIAPPFYWGINTSTRNFPGSFDVRPETMKALLTDILSNLKHWGFQKVCYINCHGEGGHNRIILESAKESRQNPGIHVSFVMDRRMIRRYGLSGKEEYILTFDFTLPPDKPKVDVPDFHAGAFETGDMVAFFPELVNTKIVKTLKPPQVKAGGYKEWGQDARKVTPLGYAGDPAAYDVDWAKKVVNKYCLAMAKAIINTR